MQTFMTKMGFTDPFSWRAEGRGPRTERQGHLWSQGLYFGFQPRCPTVPGMGMGLFKAEPPPWGRGNSWLRACPSIGQGSILQEPPCPRPWQGLEVMGGVTVMTAKHVS